MNVILPKELNLISVDSTVSVDFFCCHFSCVLNALSVYCCVAGCRPDATDYEFCSRVTAFCACAGIAASCTGKEASAKITFSADGYTPASAEIRLSSSELSHSFPAGAIFSDTPSDTAKAADSKLSLAAAAIRQELFSVYALPSGAVLIFDTGGASL